MRDTVLIAVDNSKFSEEAFNWYYKHMHRPESRVILVHCLDLPAMPSRDTWDSQTKEGREKANEVQKKFVSLATETYKMHEPEFISDFEKPGKFIVATSRKENVDVVVMGTRGLSKLERVFLGSVSNYVLNHADCPVLVVRPKPESE